MNNKVAIITKNKKGKRKTKTVTIFSLLELIYYGTYEFNLQKDVCICMGRVENTQLTLQLNIKIL